MGREKNADLPQQTADDTPDQQRRKILKSAGALGTLYLAPTTVNLLLADRATAQSGPPIMEIEIIPKK